MEEKCFCHFNGYQVKDAVARRTIEKAVPAMCDLGNAELYKRLDNQELMNGQDVAYQSAVYLPDSDKVILGYGGDPCLLVELAPDFAGVERRVIAELGHCNDMTYNPNTGKIYVATMAGAGQIAVVDPENLTVDKIITISGMGDIPTTISFNSKDGKFYIYAGNIYICDQNFKIEKLVAIPDTDIIFPSETSATQGSEIINGEFCLISWEYTDGICLNGRLLFFNMETGKVKQYFDLTPYDKYDEIEAAVAIGDSVFVLSYTWDYVWIRKISANRNRRSSDNVREYLLNNDANIIYVDESAAENGNGSERKPYNDLAVAIGQIRRGSAKTHRIILLSSTQKTGEVYLYGCQDAIEIAGNTNDIHIKRKMNFEFCARVAFRNVKICASSNQFIIARETKMSFIYPCCIYMEGAENNGTTIAVIAKWCSQIFFENTEFESCDICFASEGASVISAYNTWGYGNNILSKTTGGVIVLTKDTAQCNTVALVDESGGFISRGANLLEAQTEESE